MGKDNKPLEELAENYIKTVLTKCNIPFLKPSYDEDGSDLILFKNVNKHYCRQVIVQSKGRDLTSRKSEVTLPVQYVNSNFVCFIYLKVVGDYNDYLYTFYEADIKSWNENDGKYVLSIPKGFLKNSYFIAHSFDYTKDNNKLGSILDEGPCFSHFVVDIDYDKLSVLHLKMWMKFNSYPDINIVRNMYDNDFISGSYVEDIFQFCLLIKYSGDLEHRTPESFVYHLGGAKNQSRPLSDVVEFKDSTQIKAFSLDWSITYRNAKYGEVNVIYDGCEYNAVYAYLGDRHDYVEVVLLDNGQFFIYGS